MKKPTMEDLVPIRGERCPYGDHYHQFGQTHTESLVSWELHNDALVKFFFLCSLPLFLVIFLQLLESPRRFSVLVRILHYDLWVKIINC